MVSEKIFEPCTVKPKFGRIRAATFDMVMDDDLTIRTNRLALLKSIDALTGKVADFGKIVL